MLPVTGCSPLHGAWALLVSALLFGCDLFSFAIDATPSVTREADRRVTVSATGLCVAGVVSGGFAVVDEVLVCHPGALPEGGTEAFVLTSNVPMASGGQLEIVLEVSTPSNRPCEACGGGGFRGISSP